jgi:hypothetical protein
MTIEIKLGKALRKPLCFAKHVVPGNAVIITDKHSLYGIKNSKDCVSSRNL